MDNRETLKEFVQRELKYKGKPMHWLGYKLGAPKTKSYQNASNLARRVIERADTSDLMKLLDVFKEHEFNTSFFEQVEGIQISKMGDNNTLSYSKNEADPNLKLLLEQFEDAPPDVKAEVIKEYLKSKK